MDYTQEQKNKLFNYNPMKKLTLTTCLTSNIKSRKNFQILKNRQRCQNCVFCAKTAKSNHSFKFMLQKALYNKYSSSQNYYYTKDINDLLSKTTTRSVIYLKECQIMLSEREFLEKFCKVKEAKARIAQLTEYYKYHRDIPRIYILKIAKTIYKFHDKKRRIFYRQVKQQLGITDDSEVKLFITQIFFKKLKTKQNKDCTQTLKNILQGVKLDLTKTTYADQQDSRTFIKILLNINDNNHRLFSEISFKESFRGDKIDDNAFEQEKKQIVVPKLQLPSPTVSTSRPLSSGRLKIKSYHPMTVRENSNDKISQPHHQKMKSQFTSANKHFVYPGLATLRHSQRLIQMNQEDVRTLSNIYKSQATSPSRIITKIQAKGSLLQKSKINSKVQSCANSPAKGRRIVDCVVKKR